MKRQFLLQLLLAVSLLCPLLAQDNGPSLGDLARRQRQQKAEQSSPAPESAADLAGLKPAGFKANILITESHAAIEQWVLMPAADRAGAGRARLLVRGKKFYFPFVVTGYPWPASERMDLTARVRLVAPDGKTQFAAARFAGAAGPDPRSPSVIVLNPVMDLTFDDDDIPGKYTIIATVTDHVHSVYSRSEEQFELLKGAAGKAVVKPVTKP